MFFTSAKLGNVCAMVLFLLMYMIAFFVDSDDVPTSQLTAASLSSHTGYSFALNLFLLVESESVGINNKNVGMIVEKYIQMEHELLITFPFVFFQHFPDISSC